MANQNGAPATGRHVWDNNEVQFARLLAEIMATQETLDVPALAESMDLPIDRVHELFDRADVAWEAAKSRAFARADAEQGA